MFHYGLFLFFCGISLFAADRLEQDKRVKLEFPSGEELELLPFQLARFSFFNNLLDSDGTIPVNLGTAADMQFILKEVQNYSGKTTKQIVDMLDFIDQLGGPRSKVEEALAVLSKRFDAQEPDITEVFTGRGEWQNSLKKKYVSVLSFLFPFNTLDNFSKCNRFNIEQGFRLKGCSCSGTYALLIKKENFVDQRVRVVDVASGAEIHAWNKKALEKCFFSNFHDSCILGHNGKDRVEIIDILNFGNPEEIRLPNGNGAIHAVTLAPDGKEIAVGTSGAVLFIDKNSKNISRSYLAKGKKCFALSFSRDGALLMTGEEKLSTGQKWLFLRGSGTYNVIWRKNIEGLVSFAFAPNGITASYIYNHDGSHSTVVDLKSGAQLGGVDFDTVCKANKVAYYKNQSLVILKLLNNNYSNVLHPATFFGRSGINFYGKICFSPEGKLFCETDSRYNVEQLIDVFDVGLKIAPETLRLLPLSLFHILKMDPRNPIDPAVVAAHVTALERIKPDVRPQDRKIIDGLLERFGKKTSCSIM